MPKFITIKEAADFVKHGDTILVAGFLAVGAPISIIDELVTRDIKDLTLVANDTCTPDLATGKMIVNKQFSKIYTSHIGTNKETQRQVIENETEVILVPQGTLAECIRAGGYGLGGVLTPTGVGTAVQENKEVLSIDGKDFILEKPIRGNVALLSAKRSDKYGNLQFHGSQRNFNDVMATAADIVVVEVDEVVDVLDPDFVHIPGIFVDYVVDGGNK